MRPRMNSGILAVKPTVVVLLPRAGLGHSLLVWARAAVFAHLNGLELKAFGWSHFRLGPWLRGERTKRYYGSYFRSDGALVQRLAVFARYRATPGKHTLVNPPVEQLASSELRGKHFVVFDEVPHWSDYFRDVKAHRSFVRESLFSQLEPRIRAAVKSCPRPAIGVHARLGDFRPLMPGEDFAQVGAVRTPQSYFTGVIESLRSVKGAAAPVTIFSDGRRNELSELLSLPATDLAPPSDDIVDMLFLSRSEVIVTSAGSSFSYWAGFLSDAPIIMHPDHVHRPLRAQSEGLYEGPVSGLTAAVENHAQRNPT